MMAFLASILAGVKSLASILGFVKAYAPPKTPEQKVEEAQTQVNAEMQAEEDGARPKW